MTSLTAVTLNKIGLELEVDQLIVTKYCIGGTHRKLSDGCAASQLELSTLRENKKITPT